MLLGIDRLKIVGLFILFCLITTTTYAVENESTHSKENNYKEEKFEPGSFIFGHIKDSYGWHIIDIGETSVIVPLPVILISKDQGFVFFMSNKFEEGHSSYNRFHIGKKGETIQKKNKKGETKQINVEGKIVETLNNGTKILPLDISITKNIASLFFSILIIFLIFLSVAKAYKKNPVSAPKGLQSWLEPVIIFIRDEVAKPSIGDKKYEKFMPYLLTIFFFIWINNMMGLIPIPPAGANVTGNIAITMVLAFFTFVITTINGNKVYWKHIFNTPGVPSWLKLPPFPIMPLVETMGIFTKPFVLMVRLFANITGGHIVGLGFLTLIFMFGQVSHGLGYGVSVVSVLFMIFMSFLELLVAFIQAFVFTFLSALYFGMAVEEHH